MQPFAIFIIYSRCYIPLYRGRYGLIGESTGDLSGIVRHLSSRDDAIFTLFPSPSPPLTKGVPASGMLLGLAFIEAIVGTAEAARTLFQMTRQCPQKREAIFSCSSLVFNWYLQPLRMIIVTGLLPFIPFLKERVFSATEDNLL